MSVVDFILVKRAVSVTAGSATNVTVVLSEGTGTYSGTVDVRGTAGTGVTTRREPAVAAEHTLCVVLTDCRVSDPTERLN